MEIVHLYLLLIFLATRVFVQIAESTCTTTHRRTLKCKFPEDINESQKDFALYFYPDMGSEELLVECTWMESEFYCITQEGFELRGPVSDTAVITIPTRFWNKIGSYRCISEVYTLDNNKPCRFPYRQEFIPEWLVNSKRFSTCEVQAELDSHQVMLKCVFSSNIESFSVLHKKSLVVKYTRSSCQSSTLCHNILEDNKHVFSVKLNTSGHPHHEYFCQPDNALFAVYGCRVSIEKHTEASSAPSLAIILSFVCGMCLLSMIWNIFT